MANSRMRVPTRKGFVKIPAGDDSIPHIKRFLAITRLPFNSKEELYQFRCLGSDQQRELFINNWKPCPENVRQDQVPVPLESGLALAAA